MSDIPIARDPAIQTPRLMPDTPLPGTGRDSELLPRVIEIVARALERDVLAITFDTTFHELGADSLDTHNLILAFEDEFDLHITDEDAEHLTSIAAVVAYLGERTRR